MPAPVSKSPTLISPGLVGSRHDTGFVAGQDEDIRSIVASHMEIQRDMAQSISSLANLVKTQGQQIEQLASELKRCAGAMNQLIANNTVVPFAKPAPKGE